MKKLIGAAQISITSLVTLGLVGCSDSMPSPQVTSVTDETGLLKPATTERLQASKPNFEKQLQAFEGSLKSRLEKIGVPYPDSDWASRIKQGESYLESEQTDAALEEFQKALELIGYVKNDDPRRIKNLTDLGITYVLLEKYSDAEQQYKELLSIYEQKSPKNEHIASTCAELGRICATQSRYKDSRQYYSRALSVYSALNDPGHFNTKWILQELAVLDQSEGKYELAVPLYKQLIALYQVDEPRHVSAEQREQDQWLLAVAMHHLADIYVVEKKFEAAEPLLTTVIDIYGKQLPDETVAQSDLDACAMLTDVADYEIKNHHFAQARKIVERLIETERKLMPTDSEMLKKNDQRLALIKAKMSPQNRT